MADVYSSNDALLCDYEKLKLEYRNKAGRYIKNLLKLQRAENGVTAQIYKLKGPLAFSPRQDSQKYYCSFCAKSQDDVERMIAGNNKICICNECARLCGEILDEQEAEDAKEREKGSS